MNEAETKTKHIDPAPESGGLGHRGGQPHPKLAVRYAYASNGRGIYRIDMQTGQEGEIAGYPTPEELWSMTFPSTRSGAGDAAERPVSLPNCGATASPPSLSKTRVAHIPAGIIRTSPSNA